MVYLVYDGSFEGLISAVFDVYDQELSQVKLIHKKYEIPDLFARKIEVDFSEQKFKRVSEKLIEYLGKSGFNSLWKTTLSELPEADDLILRLIQYTFLKKKNILKNYGHPDVLRLQQILKSLNRERHRMNAFVRFELGKDQVFYATIEPDFDVLPLISNHFKNRYADQKWLIFDLKRNYGIYYDLNTVSTLEIVKDGAHNQPSVLAVGWDSTELEYQKLWKNYFKSTNIKSRKNTKLHLQHVPKRYWRYLTEKLY